MQEIIHPIGEFQEQPFSVTELKDRLADIKFLPNLLEQSLLNLDEFHLSVPYRDGGWNIRQIVHHLADSHMNAYIRCKLACTEDNPIIKPYDQDKWAELSDNDVVPVNISVTLLFALHHRWHSFFSQLQEADWNKTVMHPEYNCQMSLWFILGKYAWHGKHHVAQINALRAFKKW